MSIFLLKRTVVYVNRDPHFLDVSEAFDRSNHDLLFAKLIRPNVWGAVCNKNYI